MTSDPLSRPPRTGIGTGTGTGTGTALIDSLAGRLRPVRHRRPWREAAILAGLFVLEVALLLWQGRMRPDMPHAMHMPSFWWKMGSLASIVAVSSATTLLSLDPTRSPRRGLRALVVLVLAALALGWLVDATQSALMDGGASLWQRLDPPSGLACARKIVMLSLPVAAALGVLMRRGAAVDPPGSAWAAGAAASAWGALAFACACPFDDPLYLAVWYLLACLVVTVLSRLLLPPLSRW